jgi:uncharacterized protein YjbJ (UPF0337 family)
VDAAAEVVALTPQRLRREAKLRAAAAVLRRKTRGGRRHAFCNGSSTFGGAMNWEQVEGNWKEFKGKIRSKWAKFTDDDLEQIAGKRDELVGRLQQHYGMKKEQAERQLDEFVHRVPAGNEPPEEDIEAESETETERRS